MNESETFQCHLEHAVVHGELFNRKSLGKPIIVVAGGPGLPYGYLVNIATLLPNHPIIFYDPAGVGQSESLIGSTCWQLNYFVEEIESIRQHFAIDDMVLLAHSAGTIVALEYTLAHHNRVGHLIMVSPIMCAELFQKQLRHLVELFPETLQQPLIDLLDGKAVDALDSMQSLAYFYEHHMYCQPIWPESLLEASRQLNHQMCEHLWGVNDFALTGSWRHYDSLENLESVTCPVMMLCGESDFVTEASCRLYSEYLVNGTFRLLTGVSHNPHLEDPEQFKSVIEQCLSLK